MRCKKWLFVALLTLCLLAASVIPLAAVKPQEKRRVVSVVYDTSWSMSQAPFGSNDIFQYTSSKWLYARYALQMLMSLLGEEDTLLITSMTPTSPQGEEYPSIEIDLTKSDRDKEIHEKLPDPRSEAEKEVARRESIFFKENMDGTPGSSIGAAVRQMLGERGLKSKEDLQDADPNLEHWLVIFTDGIFDGVQSRQDAENEIARYISDYPSLNVIYLGFGGSNEVYDLGKGELVEKYKFSSYVADGPDSLISVMQDIANQLSGRYTLDESAYMVDGKTVTINLDAFAYSFKSISVMAQNCGAKLIDAAYNGSNVNVSQSCSIIPPEGLDMLTGCSAVIKGRPYFSGGKLVLTFDQPIENLSILAEPHITITHYYEHKEDGEYKRVDMQYINSHFTDADEIRVGYEAHDGNTGNLFDLKEMFGKVETKVTYAGNSYECGTDFPLTVGKNEVGVSVSVLDGRYTLYSSEVCIIENNPLDYQVSHEADCPTVVVSPDGSAPTLQSVYKIYREGNPLTTKAELSSYMIEVAVTDAEGNILTDAAMLNNNGTITVNTQIPFAAYGEYTERIKVIDPDKLSREHSHTVSYVPSAIKVVLNRGSGCTLTESQLAKNAATTFLFTLSSDGVDLNFDSGFLEYTLTAGGKDVSQYAVLSGNTLSYTPNASTLGETPILAGDLEIKLGVNLKDHPDVSDESGATITVMPSTYTLDAIDSPEKRVNRFALDESEAVLYFRLLRDNEPMTVNEVQNLYDAGEIVVKDQGTFSKYFWLPCGRETAVESLDGAGVIAVRVTRDWINPFQSFAAMLILNGQKPVTVTCFGLEAADTFTFTPSGLWSYIWRILVILLVIHLSLFIIGFFFARSFPTGTFLRISLRGDDLSKINPTIRTLNMTFKDKWLWHYKRLLFMLPFNADQPPESLFGMTISFVKKKPRAQITFKKSMRALNYTRLPNAAGSAYHEYLQQFRSKKYTGKRPPVKDVITVGALRRMYRGQSAGARVENKQCNLGSTAYGLYDSEQNLIEILLFIARNK